MAIQSTPDSDRAVTDLEFWKNALMRQTFQLSSANVFVQAARFLKNFVFARLLGPNLFGLWNGLQVILLYGANAHLGVLQAISREIPLARGRGDLGEIPRLARVSLTVSLMASILVASALFAIGAWLVPGGIESTALKLIAAVLVVQQLFQYFQFLLRAQDNFAFLSKLLVTAAALELAASAGFVYFLGFNGIFYGFLVSGGIVVVVGMVAERELVSHLLLESRLVTNLIRIGFPIMLTGLGYNFLTTIDRVMIIKFLGSESLGYYALGPLAVTAIGYLPVTINQVMYPKFGERYGATGDPASLAGFVRIPTMVTAYVMGGVLGAAFVALPLITLILPKFAAGITAARLLFAGYYFLSLIGSSVNLLLITNQQLRYLAGLLIAVLLAVGLNSVVLLLGLNIEGIAAAMGSTYVLFGFGLIGYTVRRYLGYPFKRLLSFFMRALRPFALGTIGVVISLNVHVDGALLSIGIRLAIFAVFYGAASYLLLRRELTRLA